MFKARLLKVSSLPWLPMPEELAEDGVTHTPLVFQAYHGGANQFDYRVGAFFTNDPNYAAKYGSPVELYELTLHDPYVFHDVFEMTEALGLDEELKDLDIELRQLNEKLPSLSQQIADPRYRELMRILDAAVAESAKTTGVDSIIIYHWKSAEIRVFDSKCVKKL